MTRQILSTAVPLLRRATQAVKDGAEATGIVFNLAMWFLVCGLFMAGMALAIGYFYNAERGTAFLFDEQVAPIGNLISQTSNATSGVMLIAGAWIVYRVLREWPFVKYLVLLGVLAAIGAAALQALVTALAFSPDTIALLGVLFLVAVFVWIGRTGGP